MLLRRILLMLIAILLFVFPAQAYTVQAEVLPVDQEFFPLEHPLTLTAWTVNTTDMISVSGSYVIDWIREKANINLVISNEFSGGEAKNQLMLAIETAEQLPDILLCTRWTKAECALYSGQGIVICLDEYLESCPNWNKLNSICGPEHAADLRMPDGHIYCYGSVNECFHLTHQARMWLYKPWLDKLLNGHLPNTTEEFYTYLHRVATMDPNGNGIADEIPLNGQILEGWATDPFTFISNSFVHNNRIWGSTNHTVAAGCYIDGSTVRCNWVEDGYREALRYMNRLFREGLLYPQVFTQNNDQLMSKVNASPHIVGAISCGYAPDIDETTQTPLPNGEWSEWICLPPLKGPNGVRLSYQSAYDYFYNCNGLITRDCKYPMEAAKLFDLLASSEGTLVQNYGAEGVCWQWCDPSEGKGINGSPVIYKDAQLPRQKNAWPSDVQICSFYDAFRSGMLVDEGKVNGNEFLLRCANLYEPFSPGIDTVYPNVYNSQEQSVQLLLYQTAIEDYVRSSSIGFITGSIDIDKDWDNYLSKLESLGHSKYRSMLQQAYDSHMASIEK